MASPQAKEVEKIIYDYKAGVIGAGQALTMDQRRAVTDGIGQWATVRDDVTVEEVELGGRPALLHTPDNVKSGMVALYMHGGGYVMGSLKSHGRLMAHLAHHTAAPVYGLDFRRAPEHPFPAALDDTKAAYDALLAMGWTPDQIVLAGDSAGGGLVLAVMSLIRDEGELPAGGMLLSPWLDLALTGESMQTTCRCGPVDDATDARGVRGHVRRERPRGQSHDLAHVHGLPRSATADHPREFLGDPPGRCTDGRCQCVGRGRRRRVPGMGRSASRLPALRRLPPGGRRVPSRHRGVVREAQGSLSARARRCTEGLGNAYRDCGALHFTEHEDR